MSRVQKIWKNVTVTSPSIASYTWIFTISFGTIFLLETNSR